MINWLLSFRQQQVMYNNEPNVLLSLSCLT